MNKWQKPDKIEVNKLLIKECILEKKTKKNIVIVDDDSSFIIILKSMIKESQFEIEVHSANNVEEGFNLVLDVSADLFILDIELPKSSGINLSNAIDQLGENGVPTIFVSNDYKNKDLLKTLDTNKETWFVKKPVEKEIFLPVLENCLNKELPFQAQEKFGLTKRPRPIVIISLFHIFEPIIKILYLKLNTGFDWPTVFTTLLSIDRVSAFIDFWLVFPIAGLLLLTFWRIPYYLFILIQTYIIYLHLTYEQFTWPYVSEQPLLFSSSLVIFNIILIIYLSLPKVRRPFFDKSIKWWATPTRHEIQIPCSLYFKDKVLVGKTLNISRSGMFFRTDEQFDKNTPIKVQFDKNNFQFTFRANIVHNGIFKGEKGLGIRFKVWQLGDYYKVVRFMSALKSLKL